MPNSTSYNWRSVVRTENRKGGNQRIGGGIATGVSNDFVSKDLNHTIPEVLKEKWEYKRHNYVVRY